MIAGGGWLVVGRGGEGVWVGFDVVHLDGEADADGHGVGVSLETCGDAGWIDEVIWRADCFFADSRGRFVRRSVETASGRGASSVVGAPIPQIEEGEQDDYGAERDSDQSSDSFFTIDAGRSMAWFWFGKHGPARGRRASFF